MCFQVILCRKIIRLKKFVMLTPMKKFSINFFITNLYPRKLDHSNITLHLWAGDGGIESTRIQLHQRSTYSFYARRSRMRKKTVKKLVSISSTYYNRILRRYFGAKKSWNVTRKSCAKHFCTKNYRVKLAIGQLPLSPRPCYGRLWRAFNVIVLNYAHMLLMICHEKAQRRNRLSFKFISQVKFSLKMFITLNKKYEGG